MTTYRITPVKHFNSQWVWWAFRNREIAGTTPTFVIAKADHFNMEAAERLCCWATAADTDTWNDFDNVTIGAVDLEFSMDTNFTADTYIYVAAVPLYPFSRVARKVNQWSTSQWVGQTASTTNFVIGSATARATMDGKTAPALPFYGLKITGDRVGDKNKAILAAYNHPNESLGAFSLEAAVDYILGASAEAEVLRDWFEFYIYPCVNPQGVWAGYFRSCPQNATLDHNRQWATTGTLECIDAFKTAMTADTGGTIDVGIDYHSDQSDNTEYSAFVNPAGTLEQAFLTEMGALIAGYGSSTTDVTTTLMYWWGNTLGADLSVTPENGGALSRDITDWKAHGQYTMQAVYEMLNDGRFTYEP